MTVRKTGRQAYMIGSVLALSIQFCGCADLYAQTTAKSSVKIMPPGEQRASYGRNQDQARRPQGGMKSKNRVLARVGGYGLQCVAFARSETGINIGGNAVNWWENAAGSYQRGSRPELGSVLTFRANPRMHLGHVAVVTNVVDTRQIDIDQANWPAPGAYQGAVTRDIRVVDVSPDNDWTAVRVALGHSTEFGSVYPTFGFIYDRADRGPVVTVGATPAAPLPPLNPVPSDLRRGSEVYLAAGESISYDEVAEATVRPALRHHTVRRQH